ncbi:MAG: hypothetical protein NVSMB2_23940 [Chloroflexota bacterium]
MVGAFPHRKTCTAGSIVSIVAEPVATADGDGTTEAAGDGDCEGCGDVAGLGGTLVAGAPMVAVGGAAGGDEQAAAKVTISPRAVERMRGIQKRGRSQ